MRRTNPLVLLALCLATLAVVATAIASSTALWVALGSSSWLEWVAIAALAVMVLWLGNLVRLYQKGRRPQLSGLRAARTLALAKAGSLTGSVLLGRYGAVVWVGLVNRHHGAARAAIIGASIGALMALALVVAGLIAEHWCELPPEPPPGRIKGRPAGPPQPAPLYPNRSLRDTGEAKTRRSTFSHV